MYGNYLAKYLSLGLLVTVTIGIQEQTLAVTINRQATLTGAFQGNANLTIDLIDDNFKDISGVVNINFPTPTPEPTPIAIPWIPIKILKWIPAPLGNISPQSLNGTFSLDLDSGGTILASMSGDTNDMIINFETFEIDESDLPVLIPNNSYSISSFDIMRSSGLGTAQGNGEYFINEFLLGNYSIEYDFGEDIETILDTPMIGTVEADVIATSTNQFTFTGSSFMTPVPEPTSILGLLVFGTIGAGIRIFHSKK